DLGARRGLAGRPRGERGAGHRPDRPGPRPGLDGGRRERRERRGRRGWRVSRWHLPWALATALTLVLAGPWTTTPAGASPDAFPGPNGPIVFDSNASGNYEIWRMDAGGGNLVQLTSN